MVKKDQPIEGQHLNFMAGTSYSITDPILKLRIAASSCFFGEPMYYHESGKTQKHASIPLTDNEIKNLRETLNAIDPQEWRSLSPDQLMIKAIDEALAFDIEKTLQEAVRLRNEDHIRTTPQVIMVRAACHNGSKGSNLIRKYAPEIMRRLDEPAVQLGYYIAAYNKGVKSKNKKIPNSLRRAWKDRIQKATEYELAKYRQDSRSVKLVDIVNLCHAKGEAINKLMKGGLTTTDKTWESIISVKSDKENWTKAIEVMGHMALLRNLCNFHKNEVDPDLYLNKLISTAKEGKQLPFRYYSAYNKISSESVSPKVLDAVEKCLMDSLGLLPTFSGKVMSLCDNSGSAQRATTSSLGTVRVSTIANLTGVLAGMRADEGYIGIFGDKLEQVPVRKTSSVFDQLKNCEYIAKSIGQSTENGVWLFFEKAINNKEHWDHIFIFSDMQAGHGGLYGTSTEKMRYNSDYGWNNGGNIDVAKLVRKYRSINPKVMVYLVQVAGYQDTLIPEFYDRTYILGGWGDGLLKFADKMNKMNSAKDEQKRNAVN